MERITNPVDPMELQRMAGALGANLSWARARCQHGHTRSESCRACEGGYIDDTAIYVMLRGPAATLPDYRPAWAITDDLEDVLYIAARFQRRIDRAHIAYTVGGVPHTACRDCRADLHDRRWWEVGARTGRFILTGFNTGPCSFCGADVERTAKETAIN